MPEKTGGKPLPIPVRLALLAGIVVVALGGAIFGLWMTGAIFAGDEAAPPPEAGDGPPLNSFIVAVILVILGGVGLVLGLGAYFIVLSTQCFIFDFSQPVLPKLKAKLFVANIFVPLLMFGGVAALLAAPLTMALVAAGAPLGIATGGSALGLFVLLQILLVWLQIWAPLEKSIIVKRLCNYGVMPQQLAGALFVGISDPSRSSLKKMTLVEDDIGALWITPEVMAYRGDSDTFDIRPEQFLGMERKADTWSTSSLAGAVHVLIRFQTPEGAERTVRFHVEGGWTLTAKARAMDRLAEQISRWVESTKATVGA
jgi:hypothetical protein